MHIKYHNELVAAIASCPSLLSTMLQKDSNGNVSMGVMLLTNTLVNWKQ